MDDYISGLNAGINSRVSKAVIDIDGKFKIITSADNNTLKIQKVIGLTPYDSLDLIYDTENNSSILKVNNIDILEKLGLMAYASNVYTKAEINANDIIFAAALNNRADKSTTSTKTNINDSITTLNNSINLKSDILTTYNKTEVDNLVVNVNGLNGIFNSPWSITSGQINLNSTGTGNYILWNTNGTNPPINGRSTGTKVCLYPGATNQPDYAIGIDSSSGIGALWFSVSASNAVYRWYCGTTKVMELKNTSLILPAALSVGTSISTSTLTATGDITAANLYSKTATNNLLNNKLNNNTGSVSTSIKNDINEDVAFFHADKGVDIKGDAVVYNNLSVYGTTELSNKLKIECNGVGGNITVVPSNDNGESCIVFYKYTDMRDSEANSMWVVGQNCWGYEGFSIGTPGLNNCLKINNVGDVNISVALTTPIISTDIIVSGIVRVSDNIEAVGTIYSSVNVLNLIANRDLTFDNIKNGIITCLNNTNGIILRLPTGVEINAGMPTVGFNQSFQWSVINLSSSQDVYIFTSYNHSYIGNGTLGPNASYRF
jgi:hypothetical protein